MTDDDDFGPVQRGGGAHSPRGLEVNPRPRPRSPRDAYEQHGPDSDEGFTPVERGRRPLVRAPRGRRWGRIILIVVLVAILAFIGLGVAAALSANSKITRVGVRGLSEPVDGRRNILLIGSDGREGMTAQERKALGTGNFDGERTDTILLLTIQGSRGAMLSFPRDLYVERCDGSTGRINAAYGIDGASCLVKTVSDLSGIGVTNFIEVDFVGFHDIVEAVGGVRMCLPEAISDADAHIDLPKGCQRLNGKESLGFVRVRKIDDDLHRIERQQQFFKELASEMATPATVLNPFRLFSTGNAVGSALTADKGLGVMDLAALGRAGAAMGKSKFPQFAVPSDPTVIGGAAVLTVNDAEADPLFASFRDGTILEQVTTGVTPEEVTLDVRNGAGVGGLAQTVADELTERGFTVSNVANAPAVETTVVQYRKGHEAEAQLVAQQSPFGAELEEVTKGPNVVLVLGADAAEAAADQQS